MCSTDFKAIIEIVTLKLLVVLSDTKTTMLLLLFVMKGFSFFRRQIFTKLFIRFVVRVENERKTSNNDDMKAMTKDGFKNASGR